MTKQVGVFRLGSELADAVRRLGQLKDRYRKLSPRGGAQHFNYALMDYLEIGYLLDLSDIIARGALARTESRGAHYRLDYPERDDRNWLHHTFARRGESGPEFDEGPVNITRHKPQARGY
jgi:succinate dehydrogenase / fumarate reductase flavoprotein subunit